MTRPWAAGHPSVTEVPRRFGARATEDRFRGAKQLDARGAAWMLAPLPAIQHSSSGRLLPRRRAAQLITTVTVAPPGLNVRCTRGLPGPSAVTVTVVVSPGASVPDIGATTTFFPRPGGPETDQVTLPPLAVSVIEPPPGEVTSSVAGLTLSVPAPGASLVLVLVLVLLLGLRFGAGGMGLAFAGEGAAIMLADGVARPGLPLPIGSTLARAVALARAVGPSVPGRPSLPEAGPALLVAIGATAPAGGTPWCGGRATQVTPAVTAATVPAAAPACAGRRCHHGGAG